MPLSSIRIASASAQPEVDWAIVYIAVAPPNDDKTPKAFISYDVYVTPSPNVPDIATTQPLRFYRYSFGDGEATLTLADPRVPLSQHSSWNVIVRAVDESGKASEPSDVFKFETTNLPPCFETSESGEDGTTKTKTGCNAAGYSPWLSMFVLACWFRSVASAHQSRNRSR